MLSLAFAAFVAFGVVLVLPGATQPALARELGLDMQRSGLLASALSLGLGAGVLLGGLLVDRWRRAPVFAAAAFVAGAALLAARPAVGYAGVLLLLALTGLGAGGFETVLNAALPQADPARGARRLAVAHAGATVGAVIGPFLIGASLASGWSLAFRALGGALLLLGAAVFTVVLPPPPPRRAANAARAPRGSSARLLVPFALGAFAYVGIETALTALLPVYAASAGLAEGRGNLAISSFWLGLFAGRIGFALLSRHAAPSQLAGGALLAAAAIGVGAPLGSHLPELWLIGAGLALGSAFPLLIALAGEALPERRGSAAGLVAGAGALGGVVGPWATGALGDLLGAELALASLAIWALLLAAAARAAARSLSARQVSS